MYTRKRVSLKYFNSNLQLLVLRSLIQTRHFSKKQVRSSTGPFLESDNNAGTVQLCSMFYRNEYRTFSFSPDIA